MEACGKESFQGPVKKAPQGKEKKTEDPEDDGELSFEEMLRREKTFEKRVKSRG